MSISITPQEIEAQRQALKGIALQQIQLNIPLSSSLRHYLQEPPTQPYSHNKEPREPEEPFWQ